MASKKYWKNLSKNFLELHDLKSTQTSIELGGYGFDVFPEVFSPLLSSDTQWFIQHLMPLVKNKKFLEIGTGCGAIGCLAKLNGARNVMVTDINPNAVKNTLHNVKKHRLDISVLLGNVYEPLPLNSKFDLIFWNHPFNYTEDISDQKDNLSLSVFDLYYSSLMKYFKDSRRFLEKEGALLLGTGNIARISTIKKIALECGYKMNLMEKEIVCLSKLNTVKMDVRLYSFLELQNTG